jgi:hypothetical protein
MLVIGKEKDMGWGRYMSEQIIGKLRWAKLIIF